MWNKGQSGNPGGRPKADGRLRDVAQQHTEKALNTLAHIAEHGKSESARVTASVALLDRGWGKPHQTADIYSGPRSVHEMTDRELMEAIVEQMPEMEPVLRSPKFNDA
jgi:hypothetical protein